MTQGARDGGASIPDKRLSPQRRGDAEFNIVKDASGFFENKNVFLCVSAPLRFNLISF
jgi:hypothetical protein